MFKRLLRIYFFKYQSFLGAGLINYLKISTPFDEASELLRNTTYLGESRKSRKFRENSFGRSLNLILNV